MDKPLHLHAAGINFFAEQRRLQPSAVFVHGFGGDLHTWDPLWSALGDQLAALRYDLRGFGQSPDIQEQPFDHAEDLLAVLDAAHIEQCDLVGVSMGGAIALHFALDHPERVRSLALISPSIVAWEWSEQWQQLWEPIVSAARAGNIDAARALWWQHPVFATTRDSLAAEDLFAEIMRYSGQQWLRDYQRDMLPDLERLHTLSVRTLLLTGGRDMDDFRLMADLIEASVANVTRVDHAELGHLLHQEDPRWCASQLVAFWQQVGSAP